MAMTNDDLEGLIRRLAKICEFQSIFCETLIDYVASDRGFDQARWSRIHAEKTRKYQVPAEQQDDPILALLRKFEGRPQ